jgi:hypothetical protein
MTMHKVLLLSIAFLSVGGTSHAGGLIADVLRDIVPDGGAQLDEVNRDLGRALDSPGPNNSLPPNIFNRSNICQTSSGSCQVESTLKGTTCFCKNGSDTVFGMIY